jgi:signal transduction histidine kinase
MMNACRRARARVAAGLSNISDRRTVGQPISARKRHMDPQSYDNALRLQGRPRDGDQLRRLAAVGLMTPGIAHDVNNMLQSVGSVLQMIDRRIAQGSIEELSTLTANGLQAIERVSALSKRLMAFSRPGAAMKSRVEVNGLLRDLQPLLQWAVGFDVVLDMALADRELVTWCDPLDLQNAVMNLAVNARDAMPDGGLFSLRTAWAELPLDLPGLLSGDYLIIAASDTGEGMTPDVIAQAFDPFFTTKDASEGFGIGLPSVKAFVEAIGGVADITSRPGLGATIRLYLPLSRARNASD